MISRRKTGRSLQIIEYMDTSQIELHFFLASFAEMVILSALVATIRARKKQTRKKFRILIEYVGAVGHRGAETLDSCGGEI
jgi:hypothetical protein